MNAPRLGGGGGRYVSGCGSDPIDESLLGGMAMKTAVRRNLCCLARVSGMLAASLVLAGSEMPANAATLVVEAPGIVYYQGSDGRRHNRGFSSVISVSVYQGGKHISSTREIKGGGLTRATEGTRPEWARGMTRDTEFRDLPSGEYEVRFRVIGHEESTKRVFLSDKDSQTRIMAVVGAKISESSAAEPADAADGSSLKKLWKLVQQLQKDNGDLRARISQLEADVERLKKKTTP